MPTFQDSAPGAKSSKFKDGLNSNIFTPFLAQPGDLDGTEETTSDMALMTAEFDNRLRVQERGSVLQQHYPNGGMAQESSSAGQYHQPNTGKSNDNKAKTERPVYSIDQKSRDDDEEEDKKEEDDNDDEYDSDFDDDDFDDDPTLEAIRQRRLAELKRQQETLLEQKAKGHGDYRIISQDEFLPECTQSKFVAVHFYHTDFERCKIMEHHLKKIAPLHLTCKFRGIQADKAPFFVTKLQVKTLPTLIVFKDGKAVDRLIGFEGLTDYSASKTQNPDEFHTSRLGRWIESTGAIEYDGPDSEDEDDEDNARKRTGTLYTSRFHAYDEDN